MISLFRGSLQLKAVSRLFPKICGLRTTRSYQINFRVSNVVTDRANIHQSEVIKGPASAIAGRGEPGG